MRAIVSFIAFAFFSLSANGIPGHPQFDAGELAEQKQNDLSDVVSPELVEFAPSSGQLPANALRVYLTFSQPMRRHQVAKLIRLVDETGAEVENPFLNLHVELWDPRQQRLTLLFDPGRVKRGVGPNVQTGAPLRAGRSYRLVVSGRMKSARGIEIGRDKAVGFVVKSAERNPIKPSSWHYRLPAAGSLESLEIGFDRIMDSPIAKRLISVKSATGERLKGRVLATESRWRFTPLKRWKPGGYLIYVHHNIEDIAGNRLRVAFDQSSSTHHSRSGIEDLSIQRFLLVE